MKNKAVIWIFYWITATSAFVTKNGFRRSLTSDRSPYYCGFAPYDRYFDPSRLFLSSRSGSGSSDSAAGGDAFARNEARTDVRNLLTQRSIQSFMFLLEECRDPHSGKWIEDFLEAQNLARFHGTGGLTNRFDGTWDGPLMEMSQQPKDVMIVSAKRRGRGHGGWSKHNPFLEERFVEFEIDIDPVSLTSRILSVREQIAKEWLNDLDILDAANKQILTSYFDRVRQDEHPLSDFAFERTAVDILTNHTAFTADASSPFRKGNFDLLYNLCTQASVHRLLRKLANGGRDQEVSFTWLRNFYVDRVEEFFDGDLPYGRADDFLDELLLTNPSVILNQEGGGKPGLADPLGLAEQIIQIRSEVIPEWKELMRTVPEDHSGIRKLLLDKQMEAWSSGPSLSEGFE